MRDTVEIEREMFEARQNLEDNVGLLAHKVRETTAVGARLRHIARENVGTIAAIGGGLALLWLIGVIRRARD
jgi:hypothetical protein